uniref:Methyltransferase n=1 Tax=viral metagenome TaxID=1070528 RepID=A0A6C0K0G4_9ZZZZ
MELTREQLLVDVLKKKTLKSVADTLNVAQGTIKRWQELGNVPSQYRFDLLRMLSSTIDYSQYTSKEKDQFFTPVALAEYCLKVFKEKVSSDGYRFIEPSAGDGSFLKLLPPDSIGLDIEPRAPNILKQDYLSWLPPPNQQYIVFGNPPFGLRGHLALKFINHSFQFADYVCFILPQLFESDGKGSPRKRVVGYNLIHSEKLSAKFHTPEGSNVEVNGVFQIWSKNQINEVFAIKKPDNNLLTVYSLSDGGTASTTRNKEMLNKCDVYLPSTCFGKETMRVYDSFNDLPNKKGYGLVFHALKPEMIEKTRKIDWGDISFLSTNSAYNLRTSIIYNALAIKPST